MKEVNNPKAVSDYIQKLDIDLAKLVNKVRQIILSTDSNIAEHIKWNSPSFFYSGEMKSFDAKEYKRDLVVMNLRKGTILLIFPTGAILKKSSKLVEGDFSDGRRMFSIQNLEVAKAREKDLKFVIKEWLSLIEK